MYVFYQLYKLIDIKKLQNMPIYGVKVVILTL